jgi:xanthine phosphoribosyltransferase
MDLGYDCIMMYYNYNQFNHDVPKLGILCESFEADTIIAVARGGMMLAHALSMYLDIRSLHSIRCESYDGTSQRSSLTFWGELTFPLAKKILIVDDIVDSGKTLHTLLPVLHTHNPTVVFKTASLFCKSSAMIQPDFSLHEAHDWIDFFWERDFLKSNLL